jgi:hypothetical protein
MFRVFISQYLQNDPRFGPMYRQIGGRPSWVWKAALAAAAIVLIVPAVVILLAAVLAFLVVFTIGSLISSLVLAVERLLGPRPRRDELITSSDNLRRNVRVIYPEPGGETEPRR